LFGPRSLAIAKGFVEDMVELVKVRMKDKKKKRKEEEKRQVVIKKKKKKRSLN
jgi:hypothetical protein